jgi:hypothetical protein
VSCRCEERGKCGTGKRGTGGDRGALKSHRDRQRGEEWRGGGAVGSGATRWEGVGGPVSGRRRHQPGSGVSGWRRAALGAMNGARRGRARG